MHAKMETIRRKLSRKLSHKIPGFMRKHVFEAEVNDFCAWQSTVSAYTWIRPWVKRMTPPSPSITTRPQHYLTVPSLCRISSSKNGKRAFYFRKIALNLSQPPFWFVSWQLNLCELTAVPFVTGDFFCIIDVHEGGKFKGKTTESQVRQDWGQKTEDRMDGKGK